MLLSVPDSGSRSTIERYGRRQRKEERVRQKGLKLSWTRTKQGRRTLWSDNQGGSQKHVTGAGSATWHMGGWRTLECCMWRTRLVNKKDLFLLFFLFFFSPLLKTRIKSFRRSPITRLAASALFHGRWPLIQPFLLHGLPAYFTILMIPRTATYTSS